MAAVKGKGRPVSSPLEVAQRKAVKGAVDLLKIQQEFEEVLKDGGGLDDPKSEREVRSVGQDRLNVAESIVKVIEQKKVKQNELAEIKLNGETKSVKRVQSAMNTLKKQEKELYDRLYDMPMLGTTQEEWDQDYGEDFKIRPLGRPGLTVEIRLVRALQDAKSLEKELRELEKQGGVSEPFDISAAAEVKINKSDGVKRSPGKPKLDELGRLDKRLLAIEKKMQQVKLGEDVSGGHSFNDNGSLLGRKRKPVTVKLQELEADRELALKEIKEEESKLSPLGKKKRQIKLIRDDARRDKIAANNAISKKEQAEKLKDYKSKRAKADKLEKKIQEAIDKNDKPSASKVATKSSESNENKTTVETAKASKGQVVEDVSSVDLEDVTAEKVKELEQQQVLLERQVAAIQAQVELKRKQKELTEQLAMLNS